MTYTAANIPLADPMMVRKFTPVGPIGCCAFGGLVLMPQYAIQNEGMADSRLPYPKDEDVVDCSNRMFEVTTWMMLHECKEMAITAFNSRRFRNLRDDSDPKSVEFELPEPDEPLLYLGNPIRILKNAEGITVFRNPEFLIKSGPQLGY